MVQAQFRLVPGTSRKAPGAPDFQTDLPAPVQGQLCPSHPGQRGNSGEPRATGATMAFLCRTVAVVSGLLESGPRDAPSLNLWGW